MQLTYAPREMSKRAHECRAMSAAGGDLFIYPYRCRIVVAHRTGS
jgi:hypothetical protein